MNSAYKIQLFALVNTIISIFGIWYTQSFYWLMIGLISFAFVMIFSVNIAMHRFISHRSFTTGKIRTKLLKYLTVISAFGSPLSWAPMHRYHHVHSGTDKDNQAPENIGYIKAWLTLYDPIKIPTSLIKDIVRDKDCMFIANNYWKLLFSYVIILYLINPLIGIFVFSFPAACCYQAAGAFGVIPHSKKFGYLVIEPNKGDTSVNSPLASLLSWGEGWHNYHHTIVKDYRHGYKWWEIDPPAWFIEKLFLGKG
jgi:stearoyl-CoA desaturase (Delta-9 desaturase)